MDQETQLIHVRVQQSKGSKVVTSVDGLPNNIEKNKLLRHLKQKFGCNGNQKEDTIFLSGDQRINLKQFLLEEEIVSEEYIRIH